MATRRGPKAGSKKAGAAVLAAAPPAAVAAPLTTADLENPNKVSGQALRELGWRRGMSRSSMDGMSDEKLRQQINLLVNRQYEEEAVA